MNSSASIDLNCDVGEGAPFDDALMELITSANVACGAHAGDEATMEKLARRAAQLGVELGAHPGYADRVNQGRRIQKMDTHELEDLVSGQIRRLQKFGVVRHVKPHGALYNQAGAEPAVAAAIVTAICAVDRQLLLYAGSGGELLAAGRRAGLRVVSEVFADRTYQSDGSLTPRSRPDCMVADEEAAVTQVMRMLRDGTVIATDGTQVLVQADTICLHGDEKQAVGFARRIRAEILGSGVLLRAPAA